MTSNKLYDNCANFLLRFGLSANSIVHSSPEERENTMYCAINRFLGDTPRSKPLYGEGLKDMGPDTYDWSPFVRFDETACFDEQERIVIEMASFIDFAMFYIEQDCWYIVDMINSHMYLSDYENCIQLGEIEHNLYDTDIIDFLKTTEYTNIALRIASSAYNDHWYRSCCPWRFHFNQEEDFIKNELQIIMDEYDENDSPLYFLEKISELLASVNIHHKMAQKYNLSEEELYVYDTLRGYYSNHFVSNYINATKAITSLFSNIKLNAKQKRGMKSVIKKKILGIANLYQIEQEILLRVNYKIMKTQKEFSEKDLYGLNIWFTNKCSEMKL